jgi:dolichol-phosphate mannosyltransferase
VVLFLLAQIAAALRVIARLVATAKGDRIAAGTAASIDSPDDLASVTVLVPVLNEEHRLAPCLAGLAAQPGSVAEILVIDGGSTDRTRDVVAAATANDPRIRWIDAAPVPKDWNGKAWGLQRGFEQRDRRTKWILTIDADVRPGTALVPSLLAHARQKHLDAFSVATSQRVSGLVEGAVHPALLASLVYRYGIPGRAVMDPEAVQANGQCFLARADVLDRIGGFGAGQYAISEDVTIARELARRGTAVGFFEPELHAGLIEVEMYASGRDAWTNWTRSLPMRDDTSGWGWWARMADMTLALGVPLLLLLARLVGMPGGSHDRSLWRLGFRLNAGLILMRLGVAAGMRRAYRNPPWTYWFSVLVDPLTVLKLWSTAVRRQHTWRGRPVRRGYNGG